MSGTELLSHLEFSGWPSISCPNKARHIGYLEGNCCLKVQAITKGWYFQSHILLRGNKLETGEILDPVYIMRLSQRSLCDGRPRAIGLVSTFTCCGVSIFQLQKFFTRNSFSSHHVPFFVLHSVTSLIRLLIH